jgi:hypothetical protein
MKSLIKAIEEKAAEVLIPEVAKRAAQKAFDEGFSEVEVEVSLSRGKYTEDQLKRLREAAQQELDKLHEEAARQNK